MSYLNQLEPDTLIGHFLAHPPQDFEVWVDDVGMPLFTTNYDLLTTLEPAIRHRMTKLPWFEYWGKLLQPKTCFYGTTVSEYALLPRGWSAAKLADHILQDVGKNYAMLVVKDIPVRSPFLDAESNAFSDAYIAALRAKGFIVIDGQALACVPVDYTDTEHYLTRLSSARRKDLRRKLKSRSKLDIQVLSCGDPCFDDPELIDCFYHLYLNVYRQSEVHFDLLTKAFFRSLLKDKKSGGVVFLYHHEGCLIGYNICFVVNDALIDKYVGFDYPAARECNLYHVSWFYNLEYAAEHNLKWYVAGWTDPEIKAYLGAQFSLTRHAVYVRNPLLHSVLRRLAPFLESDRRWVNGYKKHEITAHS